jgi:4'-phosphopantetheinyl transferase
VPLGLDLEAPRRRRDIDGLVALCCTPAEQSLFEGLAEAARADLFYQLWTVKEAWLKRRREWIAPSRLRQLDAQPAAQGQVRSWRAPQWRLALCAAAGAVRWWSAEPASSPRDWAVADAADLTAA